MNIIIATGNLGRDFEIIEAGGTTIAKNSLAVSRDYKDKKTGDYETDWIPITAFGQRAETMNRYLGKGSKIGIQGSLQTSKYTDKEGQERTGYDVIVDKFEFLDSKSDNQANQKAAKKDNSFEKASKDDNPFEDADVTDISEDSLPF